MFSDAFKKICQSTYVLVAGTRGGTVSGGTAFMIAPGVLATVAHVLYQSPGDSTEFQNDIRVMRAPEVSENKKMETAKVIAVDPEHDIGLLKVENPRTKTCVGFTTDPLSAGTDVG